LPRSGLSLSFSSEGATQWQTAPKPPSEFTVAQLHSTIEIQARIRELIKLAKEQGYLTFDDLNEALPEGSQMPTSSI